MSLINKTIADESSLVPTDHATFPSIRDDEEHHTSLKQSVIQSYMHDKFSPLNDEPKLKIFFFQFLGTLLFLGVALAVKDPAWADLIIAGSILVGVIVSGPISGANLNPGVTLSLTIKKQNKLRWNMLPMYFLAQFLGCSISLLYSEVVRDFKIQPLMPLEPIQFASCARVVLSQLIGQFMLIFFILQISNPNTTFIDNQFSGYLFIATFVHIGRKYAASSHECINSMIAFTSALIHWIQTGSGKGLLYSLLWVSGDLLGTLTGVFFYEKFFEPNVAYMRKLKRDKQQKSIQSLIEGSQIQESTIIQKNEEQG